MATGLIFKSKNISIDFSNNNYSIKALNDIPVGELILLEHVLHGSKEYVVCGIFYDRDLFNMLFPRDKEHNFQNAYEKMIYNSFNFNGEFTLGNIFAKFNHSCSPNCRMDCADCVNGNKIYGMWTHKKINKGEELAIDYSNGNTDYHDDFAKMHHFKCNCTDNDKLKIENKSIIMKNLGAFYSKRDFNMIKQYVDYYFSTISGKLALRKQKFIKNKCDDMIFIDENDI